MNTVYTISLTHDQNPEVIGKSVRSFLSLYGTPVITYVNGTKEGLSHLDTIVSPLDPSFVPLQEQVVVMVKALQEQISELRKELHGHLSQGGGWCPHEGGV